MAQITEQKEVKIDLLIPYENNAKTHSDEQIKKLQASIDEFGFISPILIDRDYNIIAGHGRTIAAKRNGIKKVPCVFVEGLTEAQRKAYILADNRLAEFGKWDFDLVNIELEGLDGLDFDIGEFNFPEVNLGDFYGDERKRTNNAYNLDLVDEDELSADFWQMPIIKNDGYIPERLIGFNYAKTSKDKTAGIHFFIDDYQFERVWNAPEKYIDILKEYDCVLSPDFSLYTEMPIPLKIWNTYRSRQIGAFYQSKGIKVIPTISWCEPETFCFCFEGIPEGSIVAISTIGVKENKNAAQIWHDGVDAMIDTINPASILVYGGKIDHEYGDREVIHYDNEVLKRWKSRE